MQRDNPIAKASCQPIRGHVSYPTDSPTATRLGLSNSLISTQILTKDTQTSPVWDVFYMISKSDLFTTLLIIVVYPIACNNGPCHNRTLWHLSLISHFGFLQIICTIYIYIYVYVNVYLRIDINNRTDNLQCICILITGLYLSVLSLKQWSKRKVNQSCLPHWFESAVDQRHERWQPECVHDLSGTNARVHGEQNYYTPGTAFTNME